MPSACPRFETWLSLRNGEKLWTNQNTNQGKAVSKTLTRSKQKGKISEILSDQKPEE